MFDIIGDIHGHADALEALLSRLGYRFRNGAWRYPRNARRVVFVGDYIDRGPQIRRVVDTVRGMTDADSAVALLGNHEYNAVAWRTLGDDGHPLRSHSHAHYRQHAATLQAYDGDECSDRELYRWMRSLPFFFESPALRVVHATWDPDLIAAIRWRAAALSEDTFLQRSAVPGTEAFRVVETLLKGAEIPLPNGVRYIDKEGTKRSTTRIRWWLTPAERRRLTAADGTVSLGAIAMPPADRDLATVRVPADQIDLPGYSDAVPVFCGHYWLTHRPRPFSPTVACVDYSIAKGGSLCAYRFDGEPALEAARFTCVPP